MTKSFDGRKIRDKILKELKSKIEKMDRPPGLAVICVGDNPVCSRYVSLKKRFADKIGVKFFDYAFDGSNSQLEIITKIKNLNSDEKIDGIMIQMPVPDKFDKFELVHSIDPKKDVDGLRFCCSYKSDFKPPVVMAILKAIEISSACHSGRDPESSDNNVLDPRFCGDDNREREDDNGVINCLENMEVVVVGRGFLVGWPVAQCLEEAVKGLVVADSDTKDLISITKTADILISAVGKHDIITPDMIKEGVVLIDAGTTEVSGELHGDIAPECYKKASFYTPVPGGIGPVTIAMLFQNLVQSKEK